MALTRVASPVGLVAILLVYTAAQLSHALPLPQPQMPVGREVAGGAGERGGASDHGRLLKRANLKGVQETYAHAHKSYKHVMVRFKPFLDKLLTSSMPDFLTDFMETVKGFTSDLAWVPNNPAIGSMLTEALTTVEGKAGAAPLPSQFKVGPGIPTPALCGNSSVCSEILKWVKTVNEDFRKGETPNPLKQIAAQNSDPAALGDWAVPGPISADAAPPEGSPFGASVPLGELPPLPNSYGPVPLEGNIPPGDIPPPP